MSDSRPSTLPVGGVTELVLEVADLDRAEDFYAGVLGFPVVARWPGRGAVWVKAGDATRIGLWLPQVGLEGGQGGAHVHFAVHVDAAAFDGLVGELKARGAEPAIHEFPALTMNDHHANRSAYLTDPDGHVVEFWTADVALHLEDPDAELPGRQS